MNPFHDYVRQETRRQFFSRGANAVGWGALAALLAREGLAPAVGMPRGSTARSRPARRISRPRRNTSSICTWSAVPRRWTCSTTNRS